MRIIILCCLAVLACGAPSEDIPEINREISTDAQQRSCNPIRCDVSCQRKQHRPGKCIDNRCVCTKGWRNDIADEAEPRSCNLSKCDEACQHYQHRSGRCDNNKCKCVKKRWSNDEVSPVNYLALEEHGETVLKGEQCNPNACNRKCVVAGLRGGQCKGKKCVCHP